MPKPNPDYPGILDAAKRIAAEQDAKPDQISIPIEIRLKDDERCDIVFHDVRIDDLDHVFQELGTTEGRARFAELIKARTEAMVAARKAE